LAIRSGSLFWKNQLVAKFNNPSWRWNIALPLMRPLDHSIQRFAKVGKATTIQYRWIFSTLWLLSISVSPSPEDPVPSIVICASQRTFGNFVGLFVPLTGRNPHSICVAGRIKNQFHAGGYAKLIENVKQMVLDGMLAQF
jgi:hypothetical protein